MKSRTRSRKPASIGSNHSSRRPTAISASEPRTGNFVLSLVMAWSPPAHNAGIVWVSAPGDYATFNSNHTPDGTRCIGSPALWRAVLGSRSKRRRDDRLRGPDLAGFDGEIVGLVDRSTHELRRAWRT